MLSLHGPLEKSDRACPFKLRKRQGFADFCIDVRSKIPVEKRIEASLFSFHHARSKDDEWKDDERKMLFHMFSACLSCRLLVFTCFLFPIRCPKKTSGSQHEGFKQVLGLSDCENPKSG